MHELWLSCVSGFGTRALAPLQAKKLVEDLVSLGSRLAIPMG